MIYGMIFQKCIGPDMFSWIRNYDPYWTTEYRISSVPPLNACIDRLFGKKDVICVSGDVKGTVKVFGASYL